MWHDPLAWTIASIVVYAVVTNVHWACHAAARRPGRFADWVVAWDRPPRGRIARGCFLLAPPLAAVALRAASPALLGLTMPQSASALALSVAVAAASVALLALARLSFARATCAVPVFRHSRPSAAQAGAVALNALLLEAHWALYRAGGILAWGAVTQGAYLGLALLGLEASSNPWRRLAFRDAGTVHRLSASAIPAVLSCLTYVLTGSSIAAYVLHVAVAIAAEALPVPDCVAPVSRRRDGSTATGLESGSSTAADVTTGA